MTQAKTKQTSRRSLDVVREKSAWITLITLVLMSLLWATHLPWGRDFTLAPEPNPFVFHALVLATISFVVIVVVAHIVVAVLAPRDANARADEREQLIGLKATTPRRLRLRGLELSSIFSFTSAPTRSALRISWWFRSSSPRPSTTRRASCIIGGESEVTQTAITNTIRRLRFERDEMTQQDLAERVGVTRQTINAIELGKYSPSLEVAFRIAAAFGVRLEEVFSYGGVQLPPQDSR